MTTATTNSTRVFNFSAGPAVLPEPVLCQAQQALWDIADSGIGIMEHSHRGTIFAEIMEETIANCRALANISNDYEILFLQGGASSQFYLVPMNFLRENQTADYLNTGSWAKKAIKEAKLFGKVHVASTSESANFNYIPTAEQISCSENPRYVHLTSNNTIAGTQYATEPTVPDGVPLINDASSDIFSRPITVSKYGLIYCGAQKNLGPAGVTLVIIRKDLLESGNENLPAMLQYRTHAAKGSMYNTPPTFGIYLMGLVFKWIMDFGGLAAMAEHNQAKAALIYDFLDNSKFFQGTAAVESRSLMNITFRGKTAELEKQFIAEAETRGLRTLKGHRSVGGMRASIYNAFPRAGCAALVEFMKEFELKHG